MSIDLQRFRDTFFEEAAEHLATIEAGLLTLEESGAESELLHQIFRAAHSIKGAAGSFGFTQLANLTHALENLLDRLRSGTLEATPALSALLLRASDALRAVVDATREGDPERVPVASLVQELERAVQAGVAGPAA